MMLVKIVDTVAATDSVGRPVDALPVREWVEGETDAAGRPVAPVALEESDVGVPVRFVSGKVAANSAGILVDTIPVVSLALVFTFTDEDGVEYIATFTDEDDVEYIAIGAA